MYRPARTSDRRSLLRLAIVSFPLPAVLLLIGLTAIAGAGVAYLSSQSSVAGCAVDDKDRSTGSGGVTSYRVYSDCGVFEVSDNIFFGKFDSADRYAAVKVGKTYDFTVVGWRIPVLSQFPNVLGATKR